LLFLSNRNDLIGQSQKAINLLDDISIILYSVVNVLDKLWTLKKHTTILLQGQYKYVLRGTIGT